MLRPLGRFLFPCRCALCGHLIADGELVICGGCLTELPIFPCTDWRDNEIARMMWKRLPIERATAMMYYQPGTPSADLITGPKFTRRDDVARTVGTLMAKHLHGRHFFDNMDVVIPMPTTAERQLQRGMNQMDEVAHGMIDTMRRMGATPPRLLTNAVERRNFSQSQARRGEKARLQGVTPDDFRVLRPDDLSARHILILDDVITSGATMAALGQAIVQATHDVRISILTVARAIEI